MNDELARRAIAAAGWMPGMRDVVDGDRVLSVSTRGQVLWVRWAVAGEAFLDEGHRWLPDLADPATLGCIESRMLAAWPGARITIDIDPWTVPTCVEIRICPAPGVPCRSFFGRGQFARVEALVAALEAAPWREGST